MQTHASARASLRAISYALGDRKPIDELDFLRDDDQRLELYKLAGLVHFAETERSIYDLASDSAAQTLRDADVERDRVGVILFVAESFDRQEAVSSLAVNDVLARLELAHAFPIGLSLGNCSNILVAIRVASAILRAGESEYVLVVSADKACRRYGGRRMFQDISIRSDAAVSVLVGPPGTGDFDVVGAEQENMPEQSYADDADKGDYALRKFKSVRRMARRLMETAGPPGPDGYAAVIANNYGLEVTKMLVELCGFPRSGGYYANVPRFAHAVAGDVLVNLLDLDAQGELRPGDAAFLLADSLTITANMCLRKTERS